MVVLLAAVRLGSRLGGTCPGGVRFQWRRALGTGVGGTQNQGVYEPKPGTLALYSPKSLEGEFCEGRLEGVL